MTRTITDANEGAVFLQSHLEKTSRQVLGRKYPEMKASRLIATDPDVLNTDVEYIKTVVEDDFGRAKIIHPAADDLPVIGVTVDEDMQPIHEEGTVIEYTLHDLGLIANSGHDPNARKMEAQRKAHLKLHEDLVWNGDASFGIMGLTSHKRIPRAIASHVISDASTGDQILGVLNMAVQTMRTDTLNIEEPNTLLMSTAAYSYIADTPRGANSDKTILQFFKDAHPEIETIEPLHYLDGAGTDGSDMMALMNRSPENVQQLLGRAPAPVTPQPYMLKVRVPMRSRHGGLKVNYPKSILLVEGLSA